MPPRTPRRSLALGLELAGALAVLVAVASVSVPGALALAGVLAMVAAQFLDDLL